MICIIGLGFVGLTTALGFAHYGYTVYGVDCDRQKVDKITNKELPFAEPKLDEVLAEELDVHFSVGNSIKDAIKKSEIVFFCVGTPHGHNGKVDLQFLLDALKECIVNRDKKKKYTFIIKSTIPPTTTQDVIKPYMEELGVEIGKDINLANNPEFLREGHCWEDFINADRIVVGVADEVTKEIVKSLYMPFGIPNYFVSYNTGEFVKYLSNTLLATMISFSNEMANLADNIGEIDIKKAFTILHEDKRWGDCDMKNYVYPGCGYGGYCLPKDTKALCVLAKERGLQVGILENVININDNMAITIVKEIKKHVKKSQRIGILGLAFKPGSNDVRGSVAAKVIEELIKQGFDNLVAYDPVAIDEFDNKYCFDVCIDYERELEAMLNEADIFIIVTAWSEFKEVKRKSKKIVLDYRYM